MKVIDYLNDLHAECWSPYIEFFMDGDDSVYVLKAYEYHGCFKDSYSIKVFCNPESAWDALQKLKDLILARSIERRSFALRWDDFIHTFSEVSFNYDSE